jgi:hypothetical protein
MRREDRGSRLTLAQFKNLVREQFFMLLLDQDASLAAIPKMLPSDMDARRAAFAAIREVLEVSAEISGETARRLSQVESLFGLNVEGGPDVPGNLIDPRAKASRRASRPGS